MEILIVEDDALQAETIESRLKKDFPGARIRKVSTERQFHLSLDSIVQNPPSVVVLDVMLRWTDPAPDLEPPPGDVRREGFSRAGLRCQKLLAQHETTSGVPVILYTVLDRNDLDRELKGLRPNVAHLRKESDLSPLVQQIREMVRD